jgi:hypothetical protein
MRNRRLERTERGYKYKVRIARLLLKYDARLASARERFFLPTTAQIISMFDWINRFFRRSENDERRRFFDMIDDLNAAGSGKPITIKRFLGFLKLRSTTLALGDPQCVISLEISNIVANEAAISASLWRYPSGSETVIGLTICLGEPTHDGSRRTIGQIGIDSAMLVVADKADIEQHWTDVGKDRIGVISTTRNGTVLRMLTKRFKLKTVRVSPFWAEVVGPVSEQLEKEIEDYLKSKPEYADYPFMYFRVQTNNSFDRVNNVQEAWDFIPVGNADQPLMCVCGTGRGDGRYNVECSYQGDIPRELSINFIED